MSEVRPLILIPSYNTGAILAQTVASVLAQKIPTWVVIDGSTDSSPALLERFIDGKHQGFRVILLARNVGKGAAIFMGLHQALAAGFTHVLCMDADGQHPADFIPKYLQRSAEHPEAMILGRPLFDESAPSLRVSGRKISNFWVNLETLGWGVDDSLFGMRVYPAADLLAVMEQTRFARRFDFDPEVAVRLAWRGVPAINLPTPVRYPSKEEGGVSQFRYFRDNILLTQMHLRLFFGFFLRFPMLLCRGLNPLDDLNPPSV